MGRRAAKIAARKGKSDALKTKVFATYGKKLVMVRFGALGSRGWGGGGWYVHILPSSPERAGWLAGRQTDEVARFHSNLIHSRIYAQINTCRPSRRAGRTRR